MTIIEIDKKTGEVVVIGDDACELCSKKEQGCNGKSSMLPGGCELPCG